MSRLAAILKVGVHLILRHLAIAVVRRFISRVRKRRPALSRYSDEKLLRTLHLIGEDGRITLAGALCFSRFPQQWFPELTITFVHYPGTDPDELGPRGERFFDNRRFDGPLIRALEQALQTVLAAMRKRTLVQGLLRQEIPEYPPEAVREALVNAVAHRDYCELARGSQVQIQMFQNRLEIQNPGGLFGPVNEDNLGDPGVQAARNQYLMQLLEDLGPAENRGSGIVTMTRAMRDAQMSPPEFVDRRTTFRVVFPNDTMLDHATVEWLNRFAYLDLTENQRLALAYTLHQEEINNRTFCLLTGSDSRDATTELHDLVSKDLLKQEGSHRWTTYRLTPAASQTSLEEEEHVASRKVGRVVAAERHQRILKLVVATGEISARSIVEALGIPRATVNYDLRKLTDSGHLERTQDDPYDPRTQYRIRTKKRRR